MSDVITEATRNIAALVSTAEALGNEVVKLRKELVVEKERATAAYNEMLAMERERDVAEKRARAVDNLRPELPPRPPDGSGLPRYGLRWNGPTSPLSVPMDTGYWTPWHLAAPLAALLAEWCPDDPFCGDELSGGPACIACGRDWGNTQDHQAEGSERCLWVRSRLALGKPTTSPSR